MTWEQFSSFNNFKSELNRSRVQVAQIATAADYEQKRLMATKAMHHKVGSANISMVSLIFN